MTDERAAHGQASGGDGPVGSRWTGPRFTTRSAAARSLKYDARELRISRNYEIEDDLCRVFGGSWVIAEWCPFNGVFCEWRSYAPEDEIEKAKINIARVGGERGWNVPYILKYLDDAPNAGGHGP